MVHQRVQLLLEVLLRIVKHVLPSEGLGQHQLNLLVRPRARRQILQALEKLLWGKGRGEGDGGGGENEFCAVGSHDSPRRSPSNHRSTAPHTNTNLKVAEGAQVLREGRQKCGTDVRVEGGKALGFREVRVPLLQPWGGT